ncbi:MAG: heavy metal-binding domain-containing protein [Alphaproteobacteria bacterium]|nr:heavy metal-binding domain-containing protein [Alphaproteobacteria bacterium]
MLVATTERVAGYRTKQTLGQVFGVVVRSRGLGGNIIAGLRSIVGGEIHEYTQLLEETRRQAVDRLVRNATVMGANAVLMMRFDSSEIGQTMSEIVAYGTAAIVEPDDAA